MGIEYRQITFETPEGATPLADYSGLKPDWVTTMHELNRIEAENIIKAQQKYFSGTIAHPIKWVNVKSLRLIHQTMFGDVWDWAGIYRKSTTSIGITPGLIPSRLAQFCYDVDSWFQNPVELTFVEMAARIHHQLVFIHPFENGNGRFARLVADRFLIAWKCPYPSWPNQLNQSGLTRKDYIQTLKSADHGDYQPLIEFMKKLGARDPKINEFQEDTHYRAYITTVSRTFILNALIKYGH